MNERIFLHTQARIRALSASRTTVRRAVQRAIGAFRDAVRALTNTAFPTVDVLPAHWDHLTQDRRKLSSAKRSKLARLEQSQ